ncbi:MAG: sigma-70 family RNA polymerase sigma factor [Spirochaetes bacterium]|nr:sigma-70 family RNA polymerase sigma factor [Spirochaetota bacterium]
MTQSGATFDAKLAASLAPQVLGTLMRRFGDIVAAEDAVQEALIAAALDWPHKSIPQNPAGWLMRVASRRMVDNIRSESARRKRESEWLENQADAVAAEEYPDPQRDDTLHLLFLCCHPSLSDASAISLTLRAVGGLTTNEIARAFLVPEATMAQRISRAKQTIKTSGIPFAVTDAERGTRLPSVLHILYLIFNEGYASSGESLQRPDLAAEAIRLARLLIQLLPANAEAEGLLALMLLNDARREARITTDGLLVPLDEQNRSLWNRASIAEGVALLTRALPRGAVGPYQLQAAIAAVHDEAQSYAATDWPQILALYDLLLRIQENPVIRLNRAVALAMVEGPRAGLEALALLLTDTHLKHHHRLFAVRGHLHEMLGEKTSALQDYQKAAALATSIPDRDYLVLKAARLQL